MQQMLVLIGRRAINDPGADICQEWSHSIATTITTDHLRTLSKLDPTHMTTFASDGCQPTWIILPLDVWM